MTKSKGVKPPAQHYLQVLLEIKNHVEQSAVKAATVLNGAINERNWEIGKTIVTKQSANKWGSNFVDMVAKDLQNMYPGNKGFSVANVYRMKAFYEAYEKIRAAARKLSELPIFALPWFHNVILLQKIKSNEERLWYAQQSLENGWSRAILESSIKSNLYKRQGKAITNFTKTLPALNSEMAQESFKDPYVFDFLTLHDEHVEYDLEHGLITNVQKLLLEMGKGFALVGRQYHLEVSNKDYYIDLLFYHFKLRCFVVVELKAREFDPRDAGQINFYLSAVDDLVRSPQDGPTIGLLLCKTKDNFTAEYALRNIVSPIGVAEYETEIMKKLPRKLKGSLPSIEEIEAEFEKQDAVAKKESKAVMKSKKVKTSKK
ncbi:PDDEXK nuclease domain-containing protein [Candidatus Babeliales bacterium]|nr:PDDEXK nuclease domain-containing protein [Candidatus Babeliales bacterium]